MAGTALWRWILVRGARQPVLVATWLVLAIWLPLVDALRPLPGTGGPEALVAWFVPVGSLAVLLALVALSLEEPFLRRLDPTTRMIGEAGALVVSALAMQLPMVAGAWIFGAWALDSLRLTPDILCLDLRLASIGLVTLALPVPTAARSGLFAVAVWPLAALGPVGGSGLAVLLDPAFPLRSATWTAQVASLLVAAAGGLAAVTLRTARGSSA